MASKNTTVDLPTDEFSVDNAPEVQDENVPDTVAHAPGSARRYMLAKEARDAATLQRSAPKQGKAWRATGVIAPSIRHAALNALGAIAEEGKDGSLLVTYEAALAAMRQLADNGLLGCSTPAARIAKFLRSGHLVAV